MLFYTKFIGTEIKMMKGIRASSPATSTRLRRLPYFLISHIAPRELTDSVSKK